MVSEGRKWPPSRAEVLVLILVVVEDTLRDQVHHTDALGQTVLILVLVEDAL